MKNMVKDIINKLNRNSLEFSDVRVTVTDSQQIFFKNGELVNISKNLGNTELGIRVLKKGNWGFAGTNIIKNDEIENKIKLAIKNAEIGAKFKRNPVKLSKQKPIVKSYAFKPLEDPFLMSDEEKISFMKNIAQKLNKEDKIVFSILDIVMYKQYKIYANSEGTFVDSVVYDVRPNMQVYASNGKEIMRRAYPGDMAGKRGGFEVVRNYKLEENIDKIVKEAIDLLDAPRIEEERADIIIGNGHLALQLHESVGHATEADRILGMEISYAGKTFIKPKMLGNFKYGSDIVNIYSDSTDEKGMGFHVVDDEGVPGRKVDIIKNGILMDQQTSREIAPLLNLEPSSNMVATCGSDIPLVRMTNFCLAPHKGSLEELIKNTENGYFVDFTKTWSIDDNRNNFQFTTEIGWKIKDGEIVGIVKEPTYFGITPQFWNSCDAICGKEEWEYHGTFYCGKGEPGQTMHLSHGVAPARFKNVVCNVKS